MKKLLIILLSLVSFEGYSATYVKSSAELSKLLSEGGVKSGDVVVWRDGVYKDQSINFNVNGATLRAESLGGVTFEGESGVVIGGEGVKVSGFVWHNPTAVTNTPVITFDATTKACEVSECVIDGSGLKVERDIDTKWVSIKGVQNIVRNSSFIDKRNMGSTVVVWFAKDVVPAHTIEGNYFTRPTSICPEGSDKAMNGQETIRIGTGGYKTARSDCRVIGNHFHECHGEMAEIISSKTCFNHFEGNLFSDSAGTLTLRTASDCVVTNNYFINDGNVPLVGGVRIVGERHKVMNNYMENMTGVSIRAAISIVRGYIGGYLPVKDAVVSGNTIVNSRSAIAVNVTQKKALAKIAPEGCVVSGNTIISKSSDDDAIIELDDFDPDVEYVDNIIYKGAQSGVKLPSVSVMPDYCRPTEQIEGLKRGAGASYYKK